MSLRLVPFDPAWVSTVGDSGAPLLDIKAIYQRPHKDPVTFTVIRDHAGFPEWDTVGGLPLQHHNKWVARGFRYVTLAGRADLVAVFNPANREKGIAPPRDPSTGMEIPFAEFVQNPRTDGPWDGQRHMQDAADQRTQEIAALTADIQEYGRTRAEALRQASDPMYRLPESFMAEQVEDTPQPPRKRGRPRNAPTTSVTELARDEATV